MFVSACANVSAMAGYCSDPRYLPFGEFHRAAPGDARSTLQLDAQRRLKLDFCNLGVVIIRAIRPAWLRWGDNDFDQSPCWDAQNLCGADGGADLRVAKVQSLDDAIRSKDAGDGA